MKAAPARQALARLAVPAGVAILLVCAGTPLAQPAATPAPAPAPDTYTVPHVTAWSCTKCSGRLHNVPIRDFGEVVPGCVYRSGQPGPRGYAWLQKQGFKGIVDMQRESDDGADRLHQMGFAYLHLALINERGPTDAQAEAFLEFVRDSSHWPLVFHCRTGIGRTTMMAALIRYAFDGWPMRKAITEGNPYRPFSFPLFGREKKWLQAWANKYPPGNWNPSQPHPDPPVITGTPPANGDSKSPAKTATTGADMASSKAASP